ncbi:hypothetical protein NLM33_37130 [Bradyrhizobium sp. CCGUVB1N3]|uniref:hypothetical protein n=1 Tax=Bradyrhizobium sp. CCGUVB1N3 TaxID=2949629 RepID=UPI0020B1D46E|nr:hypothetical protein [Bradyrhizobium sp. CCGUVB1N3]MCP3475872.1 hypothetical protein [Bradyrhizobium sp. CCGUVB1N3]
MSADVDFVLGMFLQTLSRTCAHAATACDGLIARCAKEIPRACVVEKDFRVTSDEVNLAGHGFGRIVSIPDLLVRRAEPVLRLRQFIHEPHQIVLQPKPLLQVTVASPKQGLGIRAHTEAVEMAGHVLLLCRCADLISAPASLYSPT